MPIPNEQDSRDHRPLIYLVAAVLILGAAAVLFWPQDRNPEIPPAMVLTPEAVREPAGDHTPIESSAEMALQAGVETPPVPGDALSGGEKRIVDAQSREPDAEEDGSTEKPATESAEPPTRSSSPTATQSPAREPSRSAVAQSKGPGSAGRYVLNVGAFSSRENAERLVERLARQTITAHVHMTTTETGATVYRVRVGYFQDRSDAEQYAAYLTRNHDLKSWVGPR